MACWLAGALVGLLAMNQLAPAQSDPPPESVPVSAAPEAEPTTTEDPEVPLAELRLLVKPLTQEELIVEATGWRDLVKDTVSQLTLLKIEVRREAEAAESSVGTEAPVSNGPAAGEDPAASDDENPPTDDASTPQSKADQIADLEANRTDRIDRLNIVLGALEDKGGDVETFRQYVSAVSGLDVSSVDAATGWTIISNWLHSEQGGWRWFWNIVKFLLIVVAFYFTASLIASIVQHSLSRVRKTSRLMRDFVYRFVKQVVLLIGFVVALSALEVDITPLLAAIGAAGFVVGFALQNTLSNLASGLLILAYRPFDVGDVIEAAGITGKVDSVSLFSTHVRTFDNKMMVVPNNDIWGGTITNATASPTRRVDLVFGVGYDDDLELVRSTLNSVVTQHALVLADPEPTIQINELGDSAVVFICRPWTRTEDYWTVYWDLMRDVKQAFDKAGISIPYPQRDLHLHNLPQLNS